MREHLDIGARGPYPLGMRTTLNIDDDLLRVARSLARARSVSLGTIVSELARLGLQSRRRTRAASRSGLPVFAVPEDARPITLEDVHKIEDEA
ncbi:MAG: hypothetical protein AB1505_34935 [Candidatus Latescibacterota bacterium]